MTIPTDKLTIKAQGALQAAQQMTLQAGNPEVTTSHLLAALLGQKDGVVNPIIDRIGANRGQLEEIVQGELRQLPRSAGNQPAVSQTLQKVINAAQSEAATMKDDYLSTEHLFLALAKEDEKAKSLLQLCAISADDILKALHRSKSGRKISSTGALWHRLGRTGASRQVGSGDRSGRRNTPSHSSTLQKNKK